MNPENEDIIRRLRESFFIFKGSPRVKFNRKQYEKIKKWCET